MRVDVLAACAYLLGPVSGTQSPLSFDAQSSPLPISLILLVMETHNDYVRFMVQHMDTHSFDRLTQVISLSIWLLSTPLLLLRMLASIARFPSFMLIFFTLIPIASAILMRTFLILLCLTILIYSSSIQAYRAASERGLARFTSDDWSLAEQWCKKNSKLISIYSAFAAFFMCDPLRAPVLS